MEETRICRDCGEEKPVLEFTERVKSRCIPCARAKYRASFSEYYQKKKEISSENKLNEVYVLKIGLWCKPAI